MLELIGLAALVVVAYVIGRIDQRDADDKAILEARADRVARRGKVTKP